jgi:putative transposase
VSEQRQRFIEDYLLNYYTVTELAKRFWISRKTAYKWINRYKECGQDDYKERSRRPHSCPWQTKSETVKELIKLRKKRPSWGPKKNSCRT